MRFDAKVTPKAQKVRFGKPTDPVYGVIHGVLFHCNGDSPTYKVVYWKADERQCIWLGSDEFEVIDDQE